MSDAKRGRCSTDARDRMRNFSALSERNHLHQRRHGSEQPRHLRHGASAQNQGKHSSLSAIEHDAVLHASIIWKRMRVLPSLAAR